MEWNFREQSGSVIVVDTQRRLVRLDVVDREGRVTDTIAAEEDGLYLRATSSEIPDTIRVVARGGEILRTLHPTAMVAQTEQASLGAAGD